MFNFIYARASRFTIIPEDDVESMVCVLFILYRYHVTYVKNVSITPLSTLSPPRPSAWLASQ